MEKRHIFFDRSQKTFRIYFGESLYVFSISPELGLEHLYIGCILAPGYDFRYLCQSYRQTHYLTHELRDDSRKYIFEGEGIASTALSASEVSSASKLCSTVRKETASWKIVAPPSPRNQSPQQPRDEGGEKKSLARTLSFPNLDIALIETNQPSFSTPARSPERSSPLNRMYEREIGSLGKGAICMEYSDCGTGDFRAPSFIAVNNKNGSNITPLRYIRHRIIGGKLPMPDHLPEIRCRDSGSVSTLIMTMADIITGLELDLIYSTFHAYDAITRRVVFRNCTHTSIGAADSKVLLRAMSATLDFESNSEDFFMTKLSGSWARENNVISQKLSQGMSSFGSTRGVTGHQHGNCCFISRGEPREQSGETVGFSLLYSGNFLIEAQVNETGRLRVNVGIHPETFSWFLRAGDSFSTPECVIVRSDSGMGGCSRTLHRLFTDLLIPTDPSSARPPVLLNTWEAQYFSINGESVVAMAKHIKDKEVGIDLIVIDDGWNRDDDLSGLGDWIVDETKFPQGFRRVSDELNAVGIRLGLWLEPEMVSISSNLNQRNPEWALRVPDRALQVGRNQVVLDLSRGDVRDYLFATISRLLHSANIEYLKLDMNRPLAEIYSQAMPPERLCADLCTTDKCAPMIWQSEVAHRYVLGVYELLHRVRAAFPHVIIETCASGGGRLDPGMLFYSDQVWISDNTDALSRLKIQYGASYVYPCRCLGAHISSVPNHITGNTTRLRTRAFVALSGTFGFELNIFEATQAELDFYRAVVLLFREIQPIVFLGDFYRLWNPFIVPYAAWMFVSRDQRDAVVFAFSLNSDHFSNLVPRLQLQGLRRDAEYEVLEPIPNNVSQGRGNLRIVESSTPCYQLGYESCVLTGGILMSCGLPVRFYTLDDSVMFRLMQVDKKWEGARSSKLTFPSIDSDSSSSPSPAVDNP